MRREFRDFRCDIEQWQPSHEIEAPSGGFAIPRANLVQDDL
jgi:hypothetical protein